MGPISGAGRPRCMDRADTAIDEGFDGSIRMVGAARIVRVVDHAGNARIDAADSRQKIGDIVILWPV
jgi:hypothetical protein